MTEAYARNTDPETSHEAAESLSEKTITKMEQIVVDILCKHPDGLTMQEVGELVGVPHEAISPRFAPLRRKEIIYSNGIRKSHTNRRRLVWKVVEGKCQ